MRSFCVIWFAAAALLLSACGKEGTATHDSGPTGDGPDVADSGSVEGGQGDSGQPGDSGAPGDSGVPGDGGAPSDTAVPGDVGASDTGAPADGSASTCDPNFGQAQACGGALTSTKWNYVAGCVSPAAFDALKTNCPGVQVSNVAYSMGPNSSLQFYANGGLLRVFSGKITGDAAFPQSCVKVGCGALQAGLALALLKWPGSTVTCTAATGGGCDCAVTINLFSFGGGQWAIGPTGQVTITAAGQQYPYYYCVSGTAGNTLTYTGTPQNPTDQNVTYVLQSAP